MLQNVICFQTLIEVFVVLIICLSSYTDVDIIILTIILKIICSFLTLVYLALAQILV